MFDLIGKGHAAMHEGPSKKPKLDLDELEKLERAATPAPWKVGRIKSMVWHSPAPDVWRTVADCIRVTVKSAHNHRANAKLIAAMRNALPELIAENRALRKKVRELIARIRKLEAENAELKRELKAAMEKY